ncbi:DUF3575 domain-containing protein [Odoribacter sp. OttesenSCG-928-G04]|nr:DUF3575 domain-containing protein [Odoribacter sp. OttesenSCG-928-G04]
MLYIRDLIHIELTHNNKVFAFLNYIKFLISLLCSILVLILNTEAKSTIECNLVFADPAVNFKGELTDSSRMQSISINYRINRTAIEPDYMDNEQALGILKRIFSIHPPNEIDYIVITGSASPEGPTQYNHRLVERRISSLKNYILENYPGLEESQILSVPQGENWKGLEEFIEKDANVPYRDELLDILRSELSREEQKTLITSPNFRSSYRYLQEHILPFLRGGVSSMLYFKNIPIEPMEEIILSQTEIITLTDTVTIVRVDTVYLEKTIYVQQDTAPPPKKKKPFFIATKTNLLYDIALLPNLSVEIPFGRDYKWSAIIEGNWSWWNTGANTYYYHRIQMLGIEARRWFSNHSKNPLNGWYVGLYGFGGDYDIRLFTNTNSDIGQQSLGSYSAGATFGYAMPIGRRLNLEFGIGAGYFGGKYKKYKVSDYEEGVFPLVSTHQRNYFGLTKANISLVWLIGSGINRNNRKGVAKW